MPEWDGLLPPVSCGERPIIDSVRTPVAYSRCLLQTFCMQLSSNLLCKLRTAWTICCFVSPGRSMYAWKVTAACPCIDGVWPIYAVFG